VHPGIKIRGIAEIVAGFALAILSWIAATNEAYKSGWFFILGVLLAAVNLYFGLLNFREGSRAQVTPERD